jgi:hypothetical protein
MDVLNPCLVDPKGKCEEEQAGVFYDVGCRRFFRHSLTQNANTSTDALPNVLMNYVQILSSDPRSSFGDKPNDS